MDSLREEKFQVRLSQKQSCMLFLWSHWKASVPRPLLLYVDAVIDIMSLIDWWNILELVVCLLLNPGRVYMCAYPWRGYVGVCRKPLISWTVQHVTVFRCMCWSPCFVSWSSLRATVFRCMFEFLLLLNLRCICLNPNCFWSNLHSYRCVCILIDPLLDNAHCAAVVNFVWIIIGFWPK